MAASHDRSRLRPRRRALVVSLVSVLFLVVACGDDAPTTTTLGARQTTTSSTTLLPTTATPETTSPTTTIAPTTVPTSEISSTTTVPPSTTIPFDGVTVQVTVTNGEVTGGGRIPIELGSSVRLSVTADISDEIHLHGYDLTEPVTPDEAARLDFVADIPGVFEVELEDSGVKLADLEVAP